MQVSRSRCWAVGASTSTRVPSPSPSTGIGECLTACLGGGWWSMTSAEPARSPSVLSVVCRMHAVTRAQPTPIRAMIPSCTAFPPTDKRPQHRLRHGGPLCQRCTVRGKVRGCIQNTDVERRVLTSGPRTDGPGRNHCIKESVSRTPPSFLLCALSITVIIELTTYLNNNNIPVHSIVRMAISELYRYKYRHYDQQF